MQFVRTPDARFDNLPGYPLPPHYWTIKSYQQSEPAN